MLLSTTFVAPVRIPWQEFIPEPFKSSFSKNSAIAAATLFPTKLVISNWLLLIKDFETFVSAHAKKFERLTLVNFPAIDVRFTNSVAYAQVIFLLSLLP